MAPLPSARLCLDARRERSDECRPDEPGRYSDKPPPQGGGSANGLKALFRPEAGKMGPAPSGLQEVDGLNHLL
jgi:hypothetical protein